ncbi:hypothetical protein ZWY2020_051926 [Hordeum vulgare]|nr:hypothetical protein ZWY2020_051926 [Hordeum vulgare]
MNLAMDSSTPVASAGNVVGISASIRACCAASSVTTPDQSVRGEVGGDGHQRRVDPGALEGVGQLGGGREPPHDVVRRGVIGGQDGRVGEEKAVGHGSAISGRRRRPEGWHRPRSAKAAASPGTGAWVGAAERRAGATPIRDSLQSDWCRMAARGSD